MRSHALSFLLHDKYKHESIAVGLRWMQPDTKEMLCKWADRIVLMETRFWEWIPEEFYSKILVVDVGQDRYGLTINPELLTFLEGVTAQWAALEFAI